MTVGVAVIGAGRAGMIHARNFAGRVPGGRLVAVADPVLVKAGAGCFELPGVKVLADYRAALNDPDVRAVVVATPTAAHYRLLASR
jgi:myo-inositol 2-dehydrogenase/D-chiro-inositol 1-dehydrogenase/scyllo-inositol 2-dehydrogenase (NAD+)